MTTSPYNQEQAEAIVMVRRHLEGLAPDARAHLRRRIRSYLAFRKEVARFHEAHLATVCSEQCFSNETSACCGREGIAIFFGDVVINLLLSSPAPKDGGMVYWKLNGPWIGQGMPGCTLVQWFINSVTYFCPMQRGVPVLPRAC